MDAAARLDPGLLDQRVLGNISRRDLAERSDCDAAASQMVAESVLRHAVDKGQGGRTDAGLVLKDDLLQLVCGQTATECLGLPRRLGRVPRRRIDRFAYPFEAFGGVLQLGITFQHHR
jgi:hypothetical protein